MRFCFSLGGGLRPNTKVHESPSGHERWGRFGQPRNTRNARKGFVSGYAGFCVVSYLPRRERDDGLRPNTKIHGCPSGHESICLNLSDPTLNNRFWIGTKIHKKAEFTIRQFKVIVNLGKMFWREVLNGFQFDDNRTVAPQIGDVGFVYSFTSIKDFQFLLGLERNSSECEFAFKTLLVDFFLEAVAKCPVDFKHSTLNSEHLITVNQIRTHIDSITKKRARLVNLVAIPWVRVISRPPGAVFASFRVSPAGHNKGKEVK